MDNLNIDNALLYPRLSDDWVLDLAQNPPCLRHVDGRQRYNMSEISVMILTACDGFQSVEAIIDGLMTRYPEAASEVSDDVESVLGELHHKQVLRFTPAAPVELFDVPMKTPGHSRKKLCIGMATYDDYDGVYFSIQAMRLYHPEILDQTEFVVIDNHPSGPCSSALKQMEDWVPAYRYVPCEAVRGTAVRDFIFHEANAEYVLCIDSHVMLERGSVRKLLDYFESHPDCKDLLQGPLLNDDTQHISTHFIPGWSAGMYGTWGFDSRGQKVDADAFDIPMQGLGLFACAKQAWPGFNSRFSGFGGEEGYIHEKFRQAGGRTLCLPFLRWLHRFNRPMGTRYKVNWEDRVRNYLIGRDELSLPDDDVIAHFSEYLGEANTQVMVDKVYAEIAHPFYYFDAIYCLFDEQDIQAWFEMRNVLNDFGVLHRVIPVNISDYADDVRLASVLASREIFKQAGERQYETIFIFDARERPAFELDADLSRAIDALKQQTWSLFYPGIRPEAPAADESALLELTPQQTGAGGPVACHASIYAQLLDVIPDNEESVMAWLDEVGEWTSFYDEPVIAQFAPAR